MTNKTFQWLVITFFILLASGCSTGAPAEASEAQAALAALTREQQGNYSATFTVNFTGAQAWNYQLTTRKSDAFREEVLHIEGVDPALNPGDVRMVTDGRTTWMIGEGTDQECVQFPNNQGMDPMLILPETLVTNDEVSRYMRLAGEETILGKPGFHYKASGVTTDRWQDATIEVWQEKENNALLGFTLRGGGEDPFFRAGQGTIMARYAVDQFDTSEIEPVAGCELSVPLPEAADKFVRLPGLASFETSQGIEEVAQFYQTALPQEGWSENEPAAQSGGVTVLSYRRDPEQVNIQIEVRDAGGSKVQLIFISE